MSMVEPVIAQLHATRAELLAQLAQVERALVAFDDEAPRQLDGSPAGARASVVAVLRLRGGEPADIAEILAGATALGWSSSSGRPRNVIATTVSKLARDGAIEKVGDGLYRVPAEDDLEPKLLTA